MIVTALITVAFVWIVGCIVLDIRDPMAKEWTDWCDDLMERVGQADNSSECQEAAQTLLDEWKPVEGSPLHWSLNWLLEKEAA